MKSGLPKRIQMNADMAEKYASGERRIIDVGADHGLLSIHLLKKGAFDQALLTDINEGPASRARQAIEDNLLTDKADVVVTDGLNGIAMKNGDVIVIAGMGGLNVRDIIDHFEEENGGAREDITFVLQPQKSLPQLREWLADKGYKIVDEECCEETGFYYCVLCVKYIGERVLLTDREIYYGPVMLTKFDERKDYKEFLDRVFELRARSDARLRGVLEGLNG